MAAYNTIGRAFIREKYLRALTHLKTRARLSEGVRLVPNEDETERRCCLVPEGWPRGRQLTIVRANRFIVRLVGSDAPNRASSQATTVRLRNCNAEPLPANPHSIIRASTRYVWSRTATSTDKDGDLVKTATDQDDKNRMIEN